MKKSKDFWEKSDDDSLGVGIIKKAYHEGKTISIPSFNIKISKDDGVIFDRDKFEEQENKEVDIDWDEDICPICGNDGIFKNTITELFEYKGQTKEVDDYIIYECPECDESIVDEDTLKNTEKIIRDFHRKVDDYKITGKDDKRNWIVTVNKKDGTEFKCKVRDLTRFLPED